MISLLLLLLVMLLHCSHVIFVFVFIFVFAAVQVHSSITTKMTSVYIHTHTHICRYFTIIYCMHSRCITILAKWKSISDCIYASLGNDIDNNRILIEWLDNWIYPEQHTVELNRGLDVGSSSAPRHYKSINE